MQLNQPKKSYRFRLAVKLRWIAWRNRIISSTRFQRLAASHPLLRPIARRRSAKLFDLVAGFTYSQVLQAAVESGLIEKLHPAPATASQLCQFCNLSRDAMERLLRAAAALDLVEDLGDGHWALGEQGAALHANAGAQAMIRHHRLLYRDLAEPLSLLRDNRSAPTHLSSFWAYDGQGVASTQYSALMAESVSMVADQLLSTGALNACNSLLDVGGGRGIFIGKVRELYPNMRLGLFDLPSVVAQASPFDAASDDARPIALHPGNFFNDVIPHGYDCISLVRILHDHDDDKALHLLRAIRAALPSQGKLLIAEPMAGAGAKARMGDAYFGLYLWAMRSGRPRRPKEIGALLRHAGFTKWRHIPTGLPVVASTIVAFV